MGVVPSVEVRLARSRDAPDLYSLESVEHHPTGQIIADCAAGRLTSHHEHQGLDRPSVPAKRGRRRDQRFPRSKLRFAWDRRLDQGGRVKEGCRVDRR